MKALFADTFYYLGLLNELDEHHDEAVAASRQPRLRIVTTAWVLVEVADAFATSRTRRRIKTFIERLEADTKVKFVPATQELFDRGLALYDARPDKEWSLTDCISFVVMQDEGLTDALTGDHHFQQAGFEALLA